MARLLADLELSETPRLLVFNKADQIGAEEAAHLRESSEGLVVSALDPETFAPLLERIEEELWKEGHGLGALASSID